MFPHAIEGTDCATAPSDALAWPATGTAASQEFGFFSTAKYPLRVRTVGRFGPLAVTLI